MPAANHKKPNIKIVLDADSVARECMKFFVASAECAVQAKNSFRVAISGGHTPEKFFELLGSSPDVKNLPWDKIHVFWVDERYVPHDSVFSNYRLAADAFLAKVPIPEQNVHPIPTNDADAESAAQKYEETIRSAFKVKSGQLPVFDFVILGMGADGHTGSLFPDSYACFDTKDIACVVYLLDQKLPDQPLTRITLTHPVLCAASRIVILVTGNEKAKILKEVLTREPEDIRYPVYLLWPALDKITWLVDSSAAKLL